MASERTRSVVSLGRVPRLFGVGLLSASLLVPAVVRSAAADRIYLKSGADFEVDRWWQEGDTVYYERFGGVIAIPKGDVERIEAKAKADVPTPGPGARRIYLHDGKVIGVD
jgi:hypothetical protein